MKKILIALAATTLLTGAVFAECGFDGATAKAIALRAGANAAAVNYHFGGIAPLYEEVLAEAHRRQEFEHQNLMRMADRLQGFVALLENNPELRPRLLETGGASVREALGAATCNS